MADDRIDVVVTDGVDPNIDKKLRSIADNADRGAASVLRLKAELASISATPVAKLQAATETSTATLNKQLAAQGALGKATGAGATEDIKAATSKGKLTAAIDAEAAAQVRLAAVIDKTIARQEAASAFAASSSFGKGGNPFQAEATLAAQAASVGASSRAMSAAVAEAEVVSVGSFGRIKLAAAGAYDFLRDAAYTQASRFKGFFGAGGAATIEKEAVAVGKLGAHAKGSSTAVRELFVLAREGSRGDFTRMAGSATILANALGLMSTVLVPLGLIAATAAAGMKLFQLSIQTEVNPQLKDYANTLGLTSKEMRKLGNETVGAKGKLEEFNTIKLTFGDVFHGFIKTVGEGLSSLGQNFQTVVASMGVNWGNVWSNIKSFTYAAVVGIYASVTTLASGLVVVFTNVGKIIYNAFAIVVNSVQLMVKVTANAVIDSINWLAQKSNTIFGTSWGNMQRLEGGAKGVFDNMQKFSKIDIGATFVKNVGTADRTLQGFSAKWRKNSVDAAKDRLKEASDAIKANRNPKKETDPKTKADYLNDTNKKLDDELSRMHLLKDAREEQQRLDQIEEEFAKRRQPLTTKEIQGFKDKIHAIQEFKYQQAEMDRIYDQATGPQKTFNAAIAAANDLMGRGAIKSADYKLAVGDATRALAASKDLIGANASLRTYQEALDKIAFSLANEGITQDQANQETNKAARAYKEATDTLFTLNEAMGTSTRATGLYGDAVQANNYYETIRQALIKDGKPASDLYVAGVNAEVDALMKKNAALQQQTYIQSQIGGVVNPLLDDAKFLSSKQSLYAELQRLRQTDVLNEKQAQQAKYALDAKFSQMRLTGASLFFGELAGLSSSGNKKLAAIGKAAAVAQATIDGFVAVQKALASAPPPWNFAIAGAVALKTGAQVAGILSTNVGNFRDGGDFMVQGNAGVDRNNISMNVSRGERVTVQTPEQQRNASNGNHSVSVPVKIVNVHDKSEILQHLGSDEGERVILNVIKNNPTAVAAVAQASQ